MFFTPDRATAVYKSHLAFLQPELLFEPSWGQFFGIPYRIGISRGFTVMRMTEITIVTALLV